jgi:hypothetical protein
VSFDPESNVNDVSEVHPLKLLEQRVSTDAGMRIDVNDVQFIKTRSSIRLNFDRESNVNDESDEQSEKHSSPITSSDDGMEIDPNDEQQKTNFR